MKAKFLAIAALCFAVAACEKPSVEPTPDPIVLSSFSFDAANNACLAQDIKANVGSGAIDVVLPYGVRKNDLKSLVPSFTVSNETASVTTVDGQPVISGETVLDFSVPVDILLTAGKENAQYAINVSIQGAVSFSKISESEFITSGGVRAALNPVDNKLYFAAKKLANQTWDTEAGKAILSEPNKMPYILTLNGGKVEEFCKTALIDTTADMVTIGFDDDGVAYSSFIDYTAEANKLVSVGKVTASGFTYLGNPGAIDKPITAAFSDIAPISANNIWSITSNNGAANGVPKRGLNLAKFDGSAWTPNNAFGTRTNEYTYGNLVKNIRGERYLMVIDYNSINLHLCKYDTATDTWVDAPGKIFSAAPEGENPELDGSFITTADYQHRCIDFDVAHNGDIYIIASADIFKAGIKQYAVIKYSAADGKISVVGGASPAPDFTHNNAPGCRYVSLALNGNDTPYVVLGNTFRFKEIAGEDVYDPVVYTTIDPETMQWTALQPVGGNAQAEDPMIFFDKDNRAYIVLTSLAKYDIGVKADESRATVDGGTVEVYSNVI